MTYLAASLPRPRQERPRFSYLTGLAVGIAIVVTLTLLTVQRAGATTVCGNGVVIPDPADHPELVADCEVLLSIQSTLAGTASLNWGADTALESWDGITVDEPDAGEPQRVTELNLSLKGLDGTIPAGLSGLSALEALRLSVNDLTGSIPPELGELSALRDLYLGFNDLSGAIPAQLSRLSALEALNLEGQELSGSIPPLFGRLTNLRQLNLRDNDLSGVIPTQLGGLPELYLVRLNGNQLSGAIPTQLGDLPYLVTLYLAGEGSYTGCLHANLVPRAEQRHRRAGPEPVRGATEPATRGGAAGQLHADNHRRRRRRSLAQRGDDAGAGQSEVSITASWNDATHTFAGWSGDCSGSAHDLRPGDLRRLHGRGLVHRAAGRALRRPRRRRLHPRRLPGRARRLRPGSGHPTPTGCSRATATAATSSNADEQVTVVTAAPLPPGFDRFVLNTAPLGSAPAARLAAPGTAGRYDLRVHALDRSRRPPIWSPSTCTPLATGSAGASRFPDRSS